VKTISPENIWAELQGIANRMEEASLEDALENAAMVFRDGIQDNFVYAQDSMGTGWPPRQPTPNDDGHPLLIDPSDEYDILGALRGSATGEEEIGPRGLAIGIDKDAVHPGAAVHNFGYPEKHIPQREYLYASEETADRMIEEFADAAERRIFG
jgi:hypothetical protein